MDRLNHPWNNLEQILKHILLNQKGLQENQKLQKKKGLKGLIFLNRLWLLEKESGTCLDRLFLRCLSSVQEKRIRVKEFLIKLKVLQKNIALLTITSSKKRMEFCHGESYINFI